MAKQLSEFEKAFAKARADKQKIFDWNGKKYTTEYKEEAEAKKAKPAAKPAAAAAQPKPEPKAEKPSVDPKDDPSKWGPEHDAIETPMFSPDDLIGGFALKGVRGAARAFGKAIAEGPGKSAAQKEAAKEAAKNFSKDFKDVPADEVKAVASASRAKNAAPKNKTPDPERDIAAERNLMDDMGRRAKNKAEYGKAKESNAAAREGAEENARFADEGNPNYKRGGRVKKFSGGGSVRGCGKAVRGGGRGRFV